MARMFGVTADEDETLCCQLCKRAFAALERAGLASPSSGGQGIWMHKGCLSGRAQAVLGTSEFRMKRGDFALYRLVQRLLAPTI
jgi:hypothetical protein